MALLLATLPIAAAPAQTIPAQRPWLDGALGLSTRSINLIIADTNIGSDPCSQIQTADEKLGDAPGIVLFPGLFGRRICRTQLRLNIPNHTLHLGNGTIVLDGAGPGNAAILITADGVAIEGSGPQTLIKMGRSSQDDAIRVCKGNYSGSTQGPCDLIDDISIHNLSIDGNEPDTIGYGNDTFQNGINLNGCARCAIYDTHIFDVWAQGICVAGADSPFFQNTVDIDGNAMSSQSGIPYDTSGLLDGSTVIFPATGQTSAIKSVISPSSIELVSNLGAQQGVLARILPYSHDDIFDNTVDHFGEIGIGFEAQISYSHILNNTIRDYQPNQEFSSGTAVDIDGSFPVYSDVVAGNKIINVGYGERWCGIYAPGGTTLLSVIDNKIEFTGVCIDLDNARGDNKTASVDRNNCDETSSYGLQFEGTSSFDSTGLTVEGNSVKNTSEFGIITKFLVDATFAGNSIDAVAASNGISVGIYLSDSSGSRVITNRMDRAVTGVYIYDTGAGPLGKNKFVANSCGSSVRSCGN